MRLGLVSIYPPRRHELAGGAAALATALRPHAGLAVCAVDRYGLNYGDEVVAVIGEERLPDYARAARILDAVEVDTVLILAATDAFGGPGGSHILALTAELTDRGVPFVVVLPDFATSPAPALLAALAADAAAVVADESAARMIASRGMVRPERLRIAPADLTQVTPDLVLATAPPATTTAMATITQGTRSVPIVGLDLTQWERPDTVETYARLGTVAAATLATMPRRGGADRWVVAATWAKRSLTRLRRSVPGVDDGSGWALRGFGALAGESVPRGVRERARVIRAKLADRHRPEHAHLADVALAVLGFAAEPTLSSPLRRSAAVLDSAREAAARGPAWPWFSDHLSAGATLLPQALIAAGERTGDRGMLERGIESLDWYARRSGLADPDGTLELPGTDGEDAADAGSLVEALARAHQVTHSPHYARLARRAYEWFGGRNRYGAVVHDPVLGTLDRIGSFIVGERTARAGLAHVAADLALRQAGIDVAVPERTRQRATIAA